MKRTGTKVDWNETDIGELALVFGMTRLVELKRATDEVPQINHWRETQPNQGPLPPELARAIQLLMQRGLTHALQHLLIGEVLEDAAKDVIARARKLDAKAMRDLNLLLPGRILDIDECVQGIRKAIIRCVEGVTPAETRKEQAWLNEVWTVRGKSDHGLALFSQRYIRMYLLVYFDVIRIRHAISVLREIHGQTTEQVQESLYPCFTGLKDADQRFVRLASGLDPSTGKRRIDLVPAIAAQTIVSNVMGRQSYTSVKNWLPQAVPTRKAINEMFEKWGKICGEIVVLYQLAKDGDGSALAMLKKCLTAEVKGMYERFKAAKLRSEHFE